MIYEIKWQSIKIPAVELLYHKSTFDFESFPILNLKISQLSFSFQVRYFSFKVFNSFRKKMHFKIKKKEFVAHYFQCTKSKSRGNSKLSTPILLVISLADQDQKISSRILIWTHIFVGESGVFFPKLLYISPVVSYLYIVQWNVYYKLYTAIVTGS